MALAARYRAGDDTTVLVHHSDRGVQGGFNRSTQHPDLRSVDGQTSWMVEGTDRAEPDDLARSSRDPTRDRAGVLERDRDRHHLGRGCRSSWRVVCGRDALVPAGWRYAHDHVDRTRG